MNTQLELAPPQAPPEPELKDVGWLQDTLKQAGTWMTADEILATLQIAGETHKRWLRSLATESEWLISGQKGYLHLENATLDEVNHFAAAMRSQAKLMDERAGKLLVNAHKIIK
jgi:hypothetical protein